MERKRGEIWITHGSYDPSMCPSLSQPDHPPGLQGVCVCVCVRLTSLCFGQQAHTHACVCVCVRALLRVCTSSLSRSESTWDEGHRRLNTHLVIKQSLSRGFSQKLSQICVFNWERGCIVSENKTQTRSILNTWMQLHQQDLMRTSPLWLIWKKIFIASLYINAMQ